MPLVKQASINCTVLRVSWNTSSIFIRQVYEPCNN